MKVGGTLKVTAPVVLFICDPLASRPNNYCRDHYHHILGIELADSANIGDAQS